MIKQKDLTKRILCIGFGLLCSCQAEQKPLPVVPRNVACVPEDARLLLQPCPPQGGTVRLACSSPPTSYCKYANGFSRTNVMLTQLLLLPLLERHPLDDSLRGCLAQTWALSADSLVLSLQLHKNLFWSDGMPITTRDVVFTFNGIILNEESPANFLEAFTTVQGKTTLIALDDYRLEFHLPAPLPSVPLVLASLPILPSHKITYKQISPKHLTALWSVKTPPQDIVSSGPFILQDYRPDKVVTLQKNPYFFRVDASGYRLPYVQKLQLFIIPSSTQQLVKFAAGELDFFEPNAEDFLWLKSQETLHAWTTLHASPLVSAPSAAHFAWNYDAKDPEKAALFAHHAFRCAMEHLLNRPFIIQHIYRGLAHSAGTFLLPGSPFYDPQSEQEKRPYNKARACQLLDKLNLKDVNHDGWRELPSGRPLTLVIQTNVMSLYPKEQDLALAFSLELRSVGIKTVVQPLGAVPFSHNIRQGDFDIVVRSFSHTPDPDIHVRVLWQPGQFLYYFHPKVYNHRTHTAQSEFFFPWETELDAMYNQAHTHSSPLQRKALYARVQHIYMHQLPVLFTVQPDPLYAISHRVHNVGLNPQGLLIYSPWTIATEP